jgi:hypothetical protein
MTGIYMILHLHSYPIYGGLFFFPQKWVIKTGVHDVWSDRDKFILVMVIPTMICSNWGM